MAMVGRSHCQVLVPGCHHHDDHDAGDEDEYDNESKAMRRMIDLEEVHTPFIISVLNIMMVLVMTVMRITHPSLLVSPAEERAKPNLDSVKPSVSRIGAVDESSLVKITIIAMITLVTMMMMTMSCL